MRLETQRLVIRDFEDADIPAMQEILADEEVMKFIEDPYTKEQTEEFVRAAGITDNKLVYALVWKETSEVIGHVIFHPSGKDEYEAGWIMSSKFWGKGIASETTEALIEEAKRIGVKTLMLECFKNQHATAHIAEKYGFVLEEDAFEQLVFRKKM